MSWIELVAQGRPPQVPKGVTPPDNATDWYRIENAADTPDETDVFVYDAIGGWFGTTADAFMKDLKAIGTPRINLRLNSPGGSVFEGITIANAIRTHPANVTVYVDGLAASIASVIALAGDRLVMMPQSQMMIHDASGGCYGNAADMEYMVGLLDKQSDNIADAYADRAGGTAAEWRDLMKAETWYTAKEAVAAGLADEVMPFPVREPDEEDEPTSTATRMKAAWDLTAYRYAGRDKAPTPPQAQPQFAAGDLLTASALTTTPLTATLPGEIVVKLDLDGADFGRYIVDAIRDTIRAELAVVEAAVSPAHSTAVKDGTWDAGAQEKKLPSPVPLATVKKMYTYYDEDKVEDGAVQKSACKLPHHFVSDDGTPGTASLSGVRNALARLPQTQGLSDAERSAAEAHLRKHLNAASSDEDDALDTEDLAASPPPPFKKKEEEEESEEEPEEEPEDAGDEDVDDAKSKKKKLPAFLQPDEDEEEEEKKESKDSSSLILARLIQSPSPCADDVLSRLKEAS